MKPKLYLCARVSDDAHKINEKFVNLLMPYFDVFAPHMKEAEFVKDKDPLKIYDLDIKAMQDADLCFTIAPYGKDCAWEMGWFAGKGKPTIMWCPDLEKSCFGDWMVSGDVRAVLTPDDLAGNELLPSPFNYITFHVTTNAVGILTHKIYQQIKGRK